MTYLEKIKDEKLKKAVQRAYSIYGYKLYFLPSSLTGRHHPKDEHGIGGLKNHIEKLCWFLEKVAEEYQYSDRERDILYTAAYFHDLGKVKQTTVTHELTYNESGKRKRLTRVSRKIGGPDLHPIISAKMATEFLSEAGVDEGTIGIIYRLIERHMGHWYPNLPKPQTELEKLFALGDYIVAKEEFRIGKRESLWEKIRKKIKH